MRSINPATGEPIGEYAEHTAEQIEARLQAARVAQRAWRGTPMEKRAEPMHRLAAVLRRDAAGHAKRMTLEMGKPIAAAEAEVEKCAWVCEHYADHAARLLAPEPVETDAASSFVRFDPLGVVLAVMPWNFPFWQLFRCAAPALMAGNAVLLKHASNVPGCALAIEHVFHDAGFPPGLFATLLVPSAGVPALIAHEVVEAVSLTGSEAAGMAVAAAAGKAIKKTVLELGGSDPFIVLADADPIAAATHATTARTINNGQSCIAAKRFIVAAALADAFENALTQRMSRLRVGDPMRRETDVGPLARRDLRDVLHEQVERSKTMGAVVRTGGTIPEGRGFYYPPTVLSGVTPGMPAFDEETFGPVAAVVRADGEDEAITLANRSRFGLGASVWTGDARRGETLAGRIESGAVFVNGIVKSDPRLPFGGVKRSGYGRELGGAGIREFVNVKSVWVG
jgi:succinate-semialdehyde dehydrogenase / glutarate-semialdehyde dehydrogenase